MMPPPSENYHPMNQNNRQAQQRHRLHSDSTPSNNNNISPPMIRTTAPSKVAPANGEADMEVVKPLRSSFTRSDRSDHYYNNHTSSKRSMDPPAALDPADLLAELDNYDDDNDNGYLKNYNGSGGGGGIIATSSSGSYSQGNSSVAIGSHHSAGGSGSQQGDGYYNNINSSNNKSNMSSGDEGAFALQQHASTATAIPAKQQLGALRSRYFQPKRSGSSVSNSSNSSSINGGIRPPPRPQAQQAYHSPREAAAQHQKQHQGLHNSITTTSSTTDTSQRYNSDSSSHPDQPRAHGGNASGVTHSIGSYSVPTFKDTPSSSSRHNRESPAQSSLRSSRSSRSRSSKSKNYLMVDSNSNDASNHFSATTKRSGFTTSNSGSSSRNSPYKNNGNNDMFGIRDDASTDNDDDDWMEEALLNGITSANKFEPPPTMTPASYSGDSSSKSSSHGTHHQYSANTADASVVARNKNNHHHHHAMEKQKSEEEKQLELLERVLDSSDRASPRRQQQQLEQVRRSLLLSRAQADLSSSERPSRQRNSQRVKFHRRSNSSGNRGGPDQLMSEMEQEEQHIRNAVAADYSQQVPTKRPASSSSSTTNSLPRRDSEISIGDLTNPEITMEDLMKQHALAAAANNHNKQSSSSSSSSNNHPATITSMIPNEYRKSGDRSGGSSNDNLLSSSQSQPPSSTTSDFDNIPTLPTIKTYKVTKSRPDEPAGLFLTKAKNGAVLVHSLSPESLFRKSTPLHPGHEVLSVNEKRVNDPKMAARLITQAKRTLSLRVSTVERSRGFMYCQVKRRNGANAGGGAPQDSSGVERGGGTGIGGESPGNAGAAAGGGGNNTARKRTGRGVATAGPSHHGVRFVTTSIDGVRRGTITEGLVRVSHIDPQGLFSNSHPMNRLHVGGIILTVNGTPVTNGRTALEKVMGSRQLIEVLHCDERVWREDWVKDGLEQVLSGQEKDPKEITCSIFSKKDGGNTKEGGEDKNNNSASLLEKNWALEWKEGREEVTLRKRGRGISMPDYAFKLIFNNDVGTCHPELVDDETMMPPADEFDVSLLVKMINDSQRTMMTVLQNMLRRAKFDLKFGSGALRSRQSVGPSSSSSKPPSVSSSRQVVVDTKDSADLLMALEDHQTSDGRRATFNSCDILGELVEDENGGVDEELSQLAESLLRVDSRDRKRNTIRASHRLFGDDQKAGDVNNNSSNSQAARRMSTSNLLMSTGFNEAIAGLSPVDIEQWRLERWENQPTTPNKIREFSARQHKMEDYYEQHRNQTRAAKIANGQYPPSSDHSRVSFAGSMFSTDMLEDFVDYLDDVSATSDSQHRLTPSNSYLKEDHESPPSPRDDAPNNWEEVVDAVEDHEPSPKEKKGDDEMAYITGVWRDVASKYEISDKVVGSGGFGEVRDCYDKKTGQIYVVKTIFKPSQDDTTKINLIRNEILLLHEAHHPNIVELRDLFEDDKYVHIVMEKCSGGDLFDRVVNENPRKLRSPAEAMKHEARTANSMRSILHVLKYLHSKGIVHRDIKPEHFLLTTNERETQKIKLIDFGLARKHKPGSAPMTTFTGSPSFVAPEVIARRYDHMCDMFSVGVTAYFLLTGMLPFDGPTDEETFDLISAGKFRFPSSSIFLSDDAKDFITRLLRTDPNKRMSAGKALNHPWLLKAASC